VPGGFPTQRLQLPPERLDLGNQLGSCFFHENLQYAEFILFFVLDLLMQVP